MGPTLISGSTRGAVCPHPNNITKPKMSFVDGIESVSGSNQVCVPPNPSDFDFSGTPQINERHQITAAAHEAYTAAIDVIAASTEGAVASKALLPNATRPIDQAESSAFEAISRIADKPEDFKRIVAQGTHAATIGVSDLALALSTLRIHGGAEVSDDCNRLSRQLCMLVMGDKLGEESGFSHWQKNNCYDKVQQLSEKIHAKLDAVVRHNKSDLFTTVFNTDVMPVIRQHLEAKFGSLSLATWKKVEEAKGTISDAAAKAATRVLSTFQSPNGGANLHSMMNQVRVAYHWAELMRPVDEKSVVPPAVEDTKNIPGDSLKESDVANTLADLPIGAEKTMINANPVININIGEKLRRSGASEDILSVTIDNKSTPMPLVNIPRASLSNLDIYNPPFSLAEINPEQYYVDLLRQQTSSGPERFKQENKTLKENRNIRLTPFKKKGEYQIRQAESKAISSTENPMLVGPGMEPVRNGRRVKIT